MSGCRVRSVRSAALLAAVVVTLLTVTSAAAQGVVHRTRFNETLEGVADAYYGEHGAAIMRVLKLVNGLHDDKLQPGMRLRIPSAWVYLAPRPTTIGVVATRYLGHRKRAVALREINHLTVRRIPAGRRLLIPFVVDHIALPSDTFASLAERYWGNTDRAAMLAQYNLTKAPAPRAGARVKIPISAVQISAERLLALTNERVLGVGSGRLSEDRAALQEANGLLRKGQFQRVALRLLRLMVRDRASDTHVAEVFKLLAVAYVGMNEHRLAVLAFEEALLRHPTMTIDPVTHSPKVIRAFVEAKERKH
ncbi:MAG: LysM peptidoglycan-binding domain-containing protein [Deltaproteobacteria bacterium]|nr:LysM peptidoglycan-binding domain-containing protein [Deltaproteobacteria bacterium]